MKDSIAITVSAREIKEKGYKVLVQEFLASKGEEHRFYFFKMNNFPTHKDLNWVFVVIGNKIRWKCRVADFVKDAQVFLSRGVYLTGNLMACFDFEQIPKCEQITMKGIQGFRYLDSETILHYI